MNCDKYRYNHTHNISRIFGIESVSKGRVTHNDILKIFCKYTELFNFKNILKIYLCVTLAFNVFTIFKIAGYYSENITSVY